MIINIFVASPLHQRRLDKVLDFFALKVGTQSVFKGRRHVKWKTRHKGRKITGKMCRCQLQSLMVIPPEF